MPSDNSTGSQLTPVDSTSMALDVKALRLPSIPNDLWSGMPSPLRTGFETGLGANSVWTNSNMVLHHPGAATGFDTARMSASSPTSIESAQWEGAFILDSNLLGAWWLGYNQQDAVLKYLVQHFVDHKQLLEHTNRMLQNLTFKVGELSSQIAGTSIQAGAETVSLSSARNFRDREVDDSTADIEDLKNDEELFDAIADGEVTAPSGIADRSIAALSSSSSSMRAAAARALSFVAPELAKQHLPEVIEKETQKFAKSVIQSALRAAAI